MLADDQGSREGAIQNAVIGKDSLMDPLLLRALDHYALATGRPTVESVTARKPRMMWKRAAKKPSKPRYQPRLYWLDKY